MIAGFADDPIVEFALITHKNDQKYGIVLLIAFLNTLLACFWTEDKIVLLVVFGRWFFPFCRKLIDNC